MKRVNEGDAGCRNPRAIEAVSRAARMLLFFTLFPVRYSRSAPLQMTKCCEYALGRLEALCTPGSGARGFLVAAATMRVRDLQTDPTEIRMIHLHTASRQWSA